MGFLFWFWFGWFLGLASALALVLTLLGLFFLLLDFPLTAIPGVLASPLWQQMFQMTGVEYVVAEIPSPVEA